MISDESDNHRVSGKPRHDDGFAALAQLESPRKRLRLTRSHCFILTGVIIHLVDGTYELFRHFYGLRRFNRVKGFASRGLTILLFAGVNPK